MESLYRNEVEAAFEPISADLERIEKLMIDVSGAATEFLGEFTTYLTRAGGKRFRPALMVLASQLGDGAGPDVDMTAAAIEMTHLATLYHDDVIDEADTRRGVVSANEKWGNKVAILAGDFLFARAAGLAAQVGGDVPAVLANAISLVVEGQINELRSTYDPRRSAEQYFETIYGKTASLLEASTYLGASLGGCSAELTSSLKGFGSALGFAFQIADDLLDLAATEEELGKPPGTDLRDGVYTLPVIYAIEADPPLALRLGRPDVDVETVTRAVWESGSYSKALAEARRYVEEAADLLAASASGPARDGLERITRLIVDRVPAELR